MAATNIGIVEAFTEGAPRVVVFGSEKVVLKTAEGDVSTKMKWINAIKDASFSLISQVCSCCQVRECRNLNSTIYI